MLILEAIVRTDRLIAIVNCLLAHGATSAATLAAHLEVSKRTIQRDMETIGLAGLPVTAFPGAACVYQSFLRMDGLKGDYDALPNERAVMAMLAFGHDCDAFTTCPVFETEHFKLRLVREEDATDLLACYAKPFRRHRNATRHWRNADMSRSQWKGVSIFSCTGNSPY